MSARSRSWLRFLRLETPRARFWGVALPIHLAAFAALYFGTLQLLESAYSEAGAAAARVQLNQAVRNMPFLVRSTRVGDSPHVFEHLLATHQPIGLRLYRLDGSSIGLRNVSVDRVERDQVRRFLADPSSGEQSWVEREGGRSWVRGLVRLKADTGCTSCHAAGETLGVAAMKIDFTDELARIHALLHDRVALLLGAWVALMAAVTVIVQRTVRRSAERLRAELAVSATGSGADGEREPAVSALPLDPVAADIHRSLRQQMQRQRQREADVAVRLARVDQLASLGQLAAGLAHEIKNPLAGIQGALEVLRDDAPESEAAPLYGEMLAELGRVNEILRRLLESGRPAPLRLARTNLARLVDDTVELLRPSLRRRRIELDAVSAADLPQLQVDPAKIRQVLVNLVQNAAEAMEENGGRIAIRIGELVDESSVAISVADDGPGISAEHLSHLFEPFFTTKFAGTGLGLTISKSLVEQHGGRLEVDSTPAGTTFLIVLPNLRHGSSLDESAAPPSSAAAVREIE
jgi:signal transduction histidine kinase